MLDTDRLTDLEIVVCTLIGESEALGEHGMTGTALTLINRAHANLKWLGGSTIRGVCLQKEQYDCWWPAEGNDDRARILQIAETNPLYGPYILGMRIAGDALAGRLTDFTNGAVSYFDPPASPSWAREKTPCYIDGSRLYFNLSSIN